MIRMHASKMDKIMQHCPAVHNTKWGGKWKSFQPVGLFHFTSLQHVVSRKPLEIMKVTCEPILTISPPSPILFEGNVCDILH